MLKKKNEAHENFPEFTQLEIKSARKNANSLAPEVQRLLQKRFPDCELGYNKEEQKYCISDGDSVQIVDDETVQETIRDGLRIIARIAAREVTKADPVKNPGEDAIDLNGGREE